MKWGIVASPMRPVLLISLLLLVLPALASAAPGSGGSSSSCRIVIPCTSHTLAGGRAGSNLTHRSKRSHGTSGWKT